MPYLFARQHHQSSTSVTHSRRLGVRAGLEVAPPVLERKIHPDVNLLAEELAVSCDASEVEGEVKQELSESSALEVGDFVGLEPRPTKGVHKKDNKLDASDVEPTQKAILAQGLSDNSPTRSVTTKPNQEHQSSGSIMRWSTSTFGKHSHTHAAQGHPAQQKTERHVASKSTSQSSLEPSQSFGSETDSQHHSTPSNAAESLRKMSTLPSPHIFGPQSPSRPEPKEDESYFDFKEVPPPLPPLDHPAFRKGPPSSFKFPLAKYNFPVLPGGQDSDANYGVNSNRQTTHSLPSMKGSTSRKSTRSPKERHQSMRSRSKSNTGIDSSSEATSYIHSRQQSKSSIATGTSRRSSAEYSAKQASSIGEDLYKMRDGCWEVEVSRAMVCLALGKEEQRVETRTGGNSKTRRLSQGGAGPSSFGKARGKNRASGGELRLGSPFLLQDTRRDNLTDLQLSKDYPAPTISNPQYRKPGAVADTHVQRKIMSNGGSTLQPTNSSATHATRKGKEEANGARPPLSAGSRSAAGRAISSPSLTPTTGASPAKLDTSSVFVSMQGSSTLQPPQVSITEATPEASPSSPTARRGHHKSTPMMPTASALKSSNAPAAIEKSYSFSGSGKRKADEAGVSGDKTPPKESKEARTTFAPEPLTHRASATPSAHAPSSFNRSKRVRLTETSDGRGSYRSSRAGSVHTPNDSPPNAKSTGSWSSKGSHGITSQSSNHYGPPPAPSASHASHYSNSQQQLRAPSRRSLSQASIPISALISPHAPSISRLSTFHMRDPRKPNPIQSTPWSLTLPSSGQGDESRWSRRGWVERGGSPLHAWLFFIGFVLFPLWWAAALFIPIPKTRRLGEAEDEEKGVVLDDPQVEHDASSWRTRCRVMAGVSLLTYIPFIVLVAIYA